MARIETITMSMREIDRLKTIQAVVDGNLKPMVAATRLNLTTRQVQRLVNRYRLEGVAGLTSRQRGHTGNRQLAPGLANGVLAIIREPSTRTALAGLLDQGCTHVSVRLRLSGHYSPAKLASLSQIGDDWNTVLASRLRCRRMAMM